MKRTFAFAVGGVCAGAWVRGVGGPGDREGEKEDREDSKDGMRREGKRRGEKGERKGKPLALASPHGHGVLKRFETC